MRICLRWILGLYRKYAGSCFACLAQVFLSFDCRLQIKNRTASNFVLALTWGTGALPWARPFPLKMQLIHKYPAHNGKPALSAHDSQ